MTAHDTETLHPFLKTIVEAKRKSVAQRKGRNRLSEITARIADAQPTRPFQKAITRSGKAMPRLIAEIKRASPSKGMLRENFDPVEIAKLYEAGGASAISILTEEDFFLGHLSFLADVKSVVSMPLLQKDFILDAFQIYEGRAAGADAILLIAAILTSAQISDYIHLAMELTLCPLVEVHTEDELESVWDAALVIGINNRDLKTFKTDLDTTSQLMKRIPMAGRANKTFVGESGIKSKQDVQQMADTGVDALLIGETFMVADSIPACIKRLFD